MAVRKRCRLCTGKITAVDYKDVFMLKNFISERGKIITRRASANCARHQKLVTRAVKRARIVALLPFSKQ
jgi:small subunit ribosomal protein S18